MKTYVLLTALIIALLNVNTWAQGRGGPRHQDRDNEWNLLLQEGPDTAPQAEQPRQMRRERNRMQNQEQCPMNNQKPRAEGRKDRNEGQGQGKMAKLRQKWQDTVASGDQEQIKKFRQKFARRMQKFAQQAPQAGPGFRQAMRNQEGNFARQSGLGRQSRWADAGPEQFGPARMQQGQGRFAREPQQQGRGWFGQGQQRGGMRQFARGPQSEYGYQNEFAPQFRRGNYQRTGRHQGWAGQGRQGYRHQAEFAPGPQRGMGRMMQQGNYDTPRGNFGRQGNYGRATRFDGQGRGWGHNGPQANFAGEFDGPDGFRSGRRGYRGEQCPFPWQGK